MRRLAMILTLVVLMTTVAGTALAATRAKRFYVYTGRTAQGIAVRLAAAKGSTRWFRYRARMTCTDHSTFLDDYFFDDVRIRKDRFSVSHTSSKGAIRTRVTGRLSGKHATGTVRIIERFSKKAIHGITPLSPHGGIVCDSKTVKWRARA